MMELPSIHAIALVPNALREPIEHSHRGGPLGMTKLAEVNRKLAIDYADRVLRVYLDNPVAHKSGS